MTENTWIRVEDGVLTIPINYNLEDIKQIKICEPGKYAVKTFSCANGEELVYYLLDIIDADISKRCVKDGEFKDDGSEVTRVEKDLIKHIFDWCRANGIHDFDMDLDNKED